MQTPFGYWHYKGDQMLQFCGTAQHFGPLIPPSESKSLILIGCSIQKLAVHGRHFSKIWPLTAVKKAERLSSWVICRITCHFLTKINMNIMEVTTCEMQQDWKSAYKCVKSVKVSFQCFPQVIIVFSFTQERIMIWSDQIVQVGITTIHSMIQCVVGRGLWCRAGRAGAPAQHP